MECGSAANAPTSHLQVEFVSGFRRRYFYIMSDSLQEIISRLWTTPENAEWTPKTDVIPLSDLQRWMESSDIEILGLTHHLLSDRRFRIEPPISLSKYVEFTKHYCERCLRENPDGEWSDSRYSAGWDLVNIFCQSLE